MEDEHGYLEQIRQALYGLDTSLTSPTASISSKKTTNSKAGGGGGGGDGATAANRTVHTSAGDGMSSSSGKASLDSDEEGPDEMKKKV